PVPFIPTTRQVFSMRTSSRWTRHSTMVAGDPGTSAKTPAQAEYGTADRDGQVPLIRMPPSTTVTSVVGLLLPAWMASGPAPKISSCAFADHSAAIHLAML